MKSICYYSKYGAPCNCEKVIRCRFFHLLIPCFHLSLTRCLLWAVLHYITIPGPPKSIFLARESNARQSDDNMESICSLDDDKNGASILPMICGRIEAQIMSSITTSFFLLHKTKFLSSLQLNIVATWNLTTSRILNAMLRNFQAVMSRKHRFKHGDPIAWVA